MYNLISYVQKFVMEMNNLPVKIHFKSQRYTDYILVRQINLTKYLPSSSNHRKIKNIFIDKSFYTFISDIT